MSDQPTPLGGETLEAEGFYEAGNRGVGMYFSVFDGSLCQRSPATVTARDPEGNATDWEGYPGEGWDIKPVKTVNPRNKNDVWTWVKRFDALVCRIVDANRHKKEFTPEQGGGKVVNYNMTLRAGTKSAVLQLNWPPDPAFKRLLKVAPNIDFTRPIAISVWRSTKSGKSKLAAAFRQGEGPDIKQWDNVPEYWRPEGGYDEQRKAIGNYVGLDGSILPPPVHDEDEDEWSWKEQEKFLIKHFVTNSLPKIKEIAKSLGLDQPEEPTGDQNSMEFSGPPLPNITEKPANCMGTSVGDMMRPAQNLEIKKLCETLGREPEAAAMKFCGCHYHELSIDGASYLINKVKKLIAKKQAAAQEAAPVAAPAPPPPPPPAPVEDDDDSWDIPAPAPSAPATPAQVAAGAAVYDPDADDDIPF